MALPGGVFSLVILGALELWLGADSRPWTPALLALTVLIVARVFLFLRRTCLAVFLWRRAAARVEKGDHDAAEPLFVRAADICPSACGTCRVYVAILNEWASLCERRGDQLKAEPLYQEALHVVKEILGDRHRDYFFTLNSLAALYESMGAYSKAEPLYVEAVCLHKASQGEKSPSYGATLGNLEACMRAKSLTEQTGVGFQQGRPVFQGARRRASSAALAVDDVDQSGLMALAAEASATDEPPSEESLPSDGPADVAEVLRMVFQNARRPLTASLLQAAATSTRQQAVPRADALELPAEAANASVQAAALEGEDAAADGRGEDRAHPGESFVQATADGLAAAAVESALDELEAERSELEQPALHGLAEPPLAGQTAQNSEPMEDAAEALTTTAVESALHELAAETSSDETPAEDVSPSSLRRRPVVSERQFATASQSHENED